MEQVSGTNTSLPEENGEFSYHYEKPSENEPYQDPTFPTETLPKKNPRLLTIIQITACTMVLLTAILLKAMGGEPYETLRLWYVDHLNRSLIAQEQMEDMEKAVASIIPEEIAPKEDSIDSNPDLSQKQESSEEAVLFTHAVGSSVPVMVSMSLTAPIQQAVVTSGFEDSEDRGGNVHKGIDLAAEAGSPIFASLSGTVESSEENTSYGKYILLDHGGGIKTLYAHCQQLLVKKGETVSRGEEIALVGSTGDATGPHLHFELQINGTCCDPAPFLPASFC